MRYFLMMNSKSKLEFPERWMESALKKDYALNYVIAKRNRKFAEDLKNERKLNELKIHSRYATDTSKAKEFYYNLPETVFQESLKQNYG